MAHVQQPLLSPFTRVQQPPVLLFVNPWVSFVATIGLQLMSGEIRELRCSHIVFEKV